MCEKLLRRTDVVPPPHAKRNAISLSGGLYEVVVAAVSRADGDGSKANGIREARKGMTHRASIPEDRGSQCRFVVRLLAAARLIRNEAPNDPLRSRQSGQPVKHQFESTACLVGASPRS